MPSRIERVGPVLRSEPNSNVALFDERRFELVAAFALLPPDSFGAACASLVDASRYDPHIPIESRTALDTLARLAKPHAND